MAKLGFKTVNEMVGQVDKLELNTALNHWKAKRLDYSKILHKPEIGPEVGTYCQMKQDHLLEKSLDQRLITKAAMPAIVESKPVVIDTPIVNTDRVVELANSLFLADMDSRGFLRIQSALISPGPQAKA